MSTSNETEHGTEHREPIAGADEAYRVLFEQHHLRLFRLACLLTADASVADEVTAEVFARVLPKWRAGRVDDPLAYLRRALVNEVRSRHRRRTYEWRAAARGRARPRVDDDPDERRLTDQPVVAALRRLPPRQRAVVVLRFHDDLSEADVARTLGMAIGSVKSHASRGLAALRTILQEER
jgi:RNA polymerase sigma-70 factor (sigma-E family)